MSATGSYGDWTAVLWLLIIVLAWFSVAAVLACWIGKALKRNRQQHTRPVRVHQPVRVVVPARDRDVA